MRSMRMVCVRASQQGGAAGGTAGRLFTQADMSMRTQASQPAAAGGGGGGGGLTFGAGMTFGGATQFDGAGGAASSAASQQAIPGGAYHHHHHHHHHHGSGVGVTALGDAAGYDALLLSQQHDGDLGLLGGGDDAFVDPTTGQAV